MLDEAHTVEAVAGDHLGLRRHLGQVEYTLSEALQRPHAQGPARASRLHASIAQQVERCRLCADEFFGDLWHWSTMSGPTATAASPRRSWSANELAEQLPDSGAEVQRGRQSASRMRRDRQDLMSAHDRLLALAGEIEAWRMQDDARAPSTGSNDAGSRWTATRCRCRAAPIDVGPALREQLFNQVRRSS